MIVVKWIIAAEKRWEEKTICQEEAKTSESGRMDAGKHGLSAAMNQMARRNTGICMRRPMPRSNARVALKVLCKASIAG